MADLLEMGAARLDLLGQRMNVAEAALERATREDRVDAGGLVGEVGHLDRAVSAIRESPRGALRDASCMNSDSIARAMPDATAAPPTA